MRAIETDVLATGGASWAAKMAQIGKLQDEVDLLRIGLADAKQRLALYRAEAVNTAALLRQERAMSLDLAAALLWAMGGEHAE